MANRSRVDKIVSAYARRKSLPAEQLPALIASIHSALAGTEAHRQIELAEKLLPALPIERLIQPKSRIKKIRKPRGSLGDQTGEFPVTALDDVTPTLPSAS